MGFGKSDPNFDPNCDPNKPVKITYQDVTSAAYNIKDGIERTPCTHCNNIDAYGMDLYFKKEFLLPTGSFKERGARNCLLQLDEKQKKAGVISASMGNHAQGISYHGMKLNIPVTVVMPKIAAIMKIQKCRRYKANVVLEGKDMGEAKAIAMRTANEKGMLHVNGYDHPKVLAGAGTIGLEIVEQVPQADAVIVPVGGGGLLAGVVTAIKGLSPNTKVIGVESEKCPGFFNSMQKKTPTLTPAESSLADGLAVPIVGYNSFATASPLIDRIVVVKEEWIALAILRLVEEEKCVVEGAGAVGLAAILSGQLNEFQGKKVVVVLSGGNIDTPIFGRCLERGLAAEGRLVKFTVHVSDRPGGISDLTDLLGELGVSIRHITQERAWLTDIYAVEVRVICETRNWTHSVELMSALNSAYKNVEFCKEPVAAVK